MAKLYFRYGTMGSAKTMNLLAVAHNYRQQNKRILLLKPGIDSRFGAWDVKSRSGLVMQADYLLSDQSQFVMANDVPKKDKPPQSLEPSKAMVPITLPLHCILVDEVQFVSPTVIDQLHSLTMAYNIPVICYGLRTNFRRELFAASKRLFEIADTIEEIKTTCHYCNHKAIYNLKIKKGVPTVTGPEVELGGEETYVPTCKTCFCKQVYPHRWSESYLSAHH